MSSTLGKIQIALAGLKMVNAGADYVAVGPSFYEELLKLNKQTVTEPCSSPSCLMGLPVYLDPEVKTFELRKW